MYLQIQNFILYTLQYDIIKMFYIKRNLHSQLVVFTHYILLYYSCFCFLQFQLLMPNHGLKILNWTFQDKQIEHHSEQTDDVSCHAAPFHINCESFLCPVNQCQMHYLPVDCLVSISVIKSSVVISCVYAKDKLYI